MTDKNDRQRRFLSLLLAENTIMNLTAVDDPDEAMTRHVEDALRLFAVTPLAGRRVIDVGTGGGLPGLPLRLQEPSIRLTLLDATEKKVDFLRRTCDALDLPDVTCVAGRAEELGRLPAYREQFDVAIARGVAFLPVLVELCLPFVAVGGVFLAMKQGDCDAEVSAAARAVAVLGGVFRDVTRYDLAGQTHAVVQIEKKHPTPEAYPRRWAAIKKRAL